MEDSPLKLEQKLICKTLYSIQSTDIWRFSSESEFLDRSNLSFYEPIPRHGFSSLCLVARELGLAKVKRNILVFHHVLDLPSHCQEEQDTEVYK